MKNLLFKRVFRLYGGLLQVRWFNFANFKFMPSGEKTFNEIYRTT